MKIRKLFAGMTAAAIMATTMAISASATNLFDVCYPSSVEENKEVNDAYYSVGAMAFFMSQKWAWNQSEWMGIDEDGVIKVEFSIGEPMADTTLSGKGTLGDMGVMVLNLPADGYPYDVLITDAKFTAEDGTVTELPTVNGIKQATEDPEGGFRIHIRPTDEVDEDTGDVKKAATPEVAGWEEEGAFNGGVLSMTINFKDAEPAADEPEETPAEETPAEETPAEETPAEETPAEETPAEENNAKTGTASNVMLGGIALAAVGIIVSKKKD